MVIEMNTKSRTINMVYDTDEKNQTDEQKRQLHIDSACMLVHAMVKSAESSYSDIQLQKIYIDILAAYAKRVIDPDSESDNIDVSARIAELRE